MEALGWLGVDVQIKEKDEKNKGQRKILREMRETMLETKLQEQSWNYRNRKEKQVTSERE